MQDRRIVVTGGFGQLGGALERAGRARGACIALIDRAGPADSKQGVLSLGGVDLRSECDALRGIEWAARELGGIDALINTAGAFRWQSLESGPTKTWAELYELNVLTAVHASRAALPHLLRSGCGRIVNVGANAALKAQGGMGCYAASKAGVHRLTESLADELNGQGVTVNAVLPSVLDTPANRREMPEADFSKWVRTDELAEIILFLCSAEARAINGALLPVVGGV